MEISKIDCLPGSLLVTGGAGGTGEGETGLKGEPSRVEYGPLLREHHQQELSCLSEGLKGAKGT